MRTLIAALLLIVCTAANAQLTPACYPTLDPDKAYPTKLPFQLWRSDGTALYWYCWDGAKWVGYFRSLPASAIPTLLAKSGEVSLDELLAKATKAITSAADPRAKINEITAAWADTGHTCAEAIAQNAADKQLCEAVFAAMALNTPPSRAVYAVAGTGLRPTYATRSGALVSPSNGTVQAGTQCNCITNSVGKDPYRYCSVNGRIDTVALCRLP
jgi:hypothetical protein